MQNPSTKNILTLIAGFSLTVPAECRSQAEIPIIVSYDASVTSCTIETTYAVGARNDPVDQCGLSHVVEHAMFDGTINTSPGEYAYWIQAVGGTYQGSTGDTRTVFLATVPPSDLDLVFYLEGDRSRFLAINALQVDSDKTVVSREIRTREGSPNDGSRLFGMRLVTGDTTPVCRSAGIESQVLQLRTEYVQHHYDTYYRGGPSMIVVTGPCTLGQVKKAARQNLGRAAEVSTKAVRAPGWKPRPEENYVVVDPMLRSLHLCFALGVPDQSRWYQSVLLASLVSSSATWPISLLEGEGLSRVPEFHLQQHSGFAIGSITLTFESEAIMQHFLDTRAGFLEETITRVLPSAVEEEKAILIADQHAEWQDPVTRAELISRTMSLYGWLYNDQTSEAQMRSVTLPALMLLSQILDRAFTSPTLYGEKGKSM